MKNIKTFNPVLLARNAIAATGLMTILNIAVDALHFSPIFPLALTIPSNYAWFLFNVPEGVETYFETLDKFYAARPWFAVIIILFVGLIVYSYLRSAKKPKAIKIGFGVVLVDTVLLLGSGISWVTIIDFLYHAFLLFYIYKGIKALKGTAHV